VICDVGFNNTVGNLSKHCIRCVYLLFKFEIFLLSVVANALEVDLKKILVSGCGIDPNFGLPEPGMDPPIRPPIGKRVSPPGDIPGHPWRVVSHNTFYYFRYDRDMTERLENRF